MSPGPQSPPAAPAPAASACATRFRGGPICWLNARPFWLRWPIKWILFLAVVFLTLFPDPGVLVRNQERVRTLGAITDPATHAADLAGWLAKLDRRLPPGAPGPATTQAVQALVYDRTDGLLYDWDWNSHGAADHWATLAEINATAARYPDGRPRDDCDGQATLAIALLRARGVPARMMFDVQHVWVWSPYGELMTPGRGTREATADGQVTNRVGVTDFIRATSFGVWAFPLSREVLWLATALLLGLAATPRGLVRLAGAAVLVAAGWWAIRHSMGLEERSAWMWAGWAAVLAGLLGQVAAGWADAWRARRRILARS